VPCMQMAAPTMVPSTTTLKVAARRRRERRACGRCLADLA
jgi:hypothetical protein